MSRFNSAPIPERSPALSEVIEQLINDGVLPAFPETMIDAHGNEISVGENAWYLPMGPAGHFITFPQDHPYLDFAIKQCAASQAIRSSSRGCANFIKDIRLLRHCPAFSKLLETTDVEAFSQQLKATILELLGELRRTQQLYRFYHVKRWYLWCAKFTPALGFNRAFANRLQKIKLPGNPKGEAVRNPAPTKGGFDLDLEVPLITAALRADKPTCRDDLMDHAATLLCLMFGRNPLAFQWLLASDLRPARKNEIGNFTLDVPTVKKRRPPRAVLQAMPASDNIAQILSSLIEANAALLTDIPAGMLPDKYVVPIFMRDRPSKSKFGTADEENCLLMTSQQFEKLLHRFVRRNHLISPRTGFLLHPTPRRFRYTFATLLVDAGIGRQELASLLGHTDLQHVGVYWEMHGRQAKHLGAAAQGWADQVLDLLTAEPGAVTQPLPSPTKTTACEHPCLRCPSLNPYETHYPRIALLRQPPTEMETH